jgi:hypothetical protein
MSICIHTYPGVQGPVIHFLDAQQYWLYNDIAEYEGSIKYHVSEF